MMLQGKHAAMEVRNLQHTEAKPSEKMYQVYVGWKSEKFWVKK